MNVQKRKMGQAIFSHRCTHVVIQSSQCAYASFAFARCDWNCAKMDVGFHSFSLKQPNANGILKYFSSLNGVNSKEH